MEINKQLYLEHPGHPIRNLGEKIRESLELWRDVGRRQRYAWSSTGGTWETILRAVRPMPAGPCLP
ncbi:hypothetical protein [Kitasatospora sp. NPDC093102]|uniref:hypothetical protein n=1 Tax=Kitasatospora sp. NPDC093102 TaxID=3155069 RepID=UPI003415FA6E